MSRFIHIILLLISFDICYGVKVSTVKLLDGNYMPVVGLGTFMINGDGMDVALSAAFESGYRHIDTAYTYENEKDIGKFLNKWFAKGGKREEIFITTKLPIFGLRPSDVQYFLDLSLKNLGLDYIDLYLIHAPYGIHRTNDFQLLQYKNGTYALDFDTDLVVVWKEMEKQVRAGKIRSIGISNFNETQVFKIWENTDIKPVINQVEFNPYIQQENLLELCNRLGMIVTGFSPLGSGALIHMRKKREIVSLPPLIRHPVVMKIAEEHNKSSAQVLLRYGLQKNLVLIPKSGNPKRIKENIDIFDFTLSQQEMDDLKNLDQHGKYRKYDYLTFNGVEHHPEYPFSDRIPK